MTFVDHRMASDGAVFVSIHPRGSHLPWSERRQPSAPVGRPKAMIDNRQKLPWEGAFCAHGPDSPRRKGLCTRLDRICHGERDFAHAWAGFASGALPRKGFARMGRMRHRCVTEKGALWALGPRHRDGTGRAVSRRAVDDTPNEPAAPRLREDRQSTAIS